MSSSAITTQVAQLKAGSIQNQADSSSIYSAGVWSFKNSTAVASVTITDAGNVGIGTASPSSFNVAGTGIATALGTGAGASTLALYSTATTSGFLYFSRGSTGADRYRGYFEYAQSDDSLRIGTVGTERMRIDASGNLMVGTTSEFGGKVSVHAGTALALKGTAGSNCGRIALIRADNSQKAWEITCNGTAFYIANQDFSKYASLTSQNFTGWTFSSDRRIKKNIVDLSYGLDAVLAMQPREFDYISDNRHDIGFVAQELKQVIPEAVSGDEVPYGEDDTLQEKAAKTMGVTKDALIPVLVKAIQELSAKVDAQAAEIAELKAKP